MKKKSKEYNRKKVFKKTEQGRRARDASRRNLEKIINSTGVGADSAAVRRCDGFAARQKGDGERRTFDAVGIFLSSRSDYGFVRIQGATDIFIPSGRTMHAIDGDEVEIEYSVFKNRFGEEKTEGRVKKIRQYGRETLIGSLSEELVLFGRRRRGYVLVFTADDRKVGERIRVCQPNGAADSDKVEIRLHRGREIYGEVIRIFGKADDFRVNYDAQLAECGIECDFSDAATEEAERVAREDVSTEGRVDRRSEIIFTVDGEGAKDLDDAVSVRRLPRGGWRLGVHIADVSHYVKERTALDRAAMARGTSVYFTDKVVPMLPKIISNGCCSLNAGEDKYALSAIMDISDDGETVAVRIEQSVIRSRVRGCYSEVNGIFGGTADARVIKKYKSVIPMLRRMHELYLVLQKRSIERGALELDSDEAEILLSDDGAPVAIERRTRGDAERMIEQFMLAANEAVASFLRKNGIPCVYRIHEAPPEDKLREFVTYVHNLGFDTSYVSMTKCSPRDFSHLLDEAKRRGVYSPVSYIMLRTLSKARYSEMQCPHFGLGIENYCHFTSPIRRLGDLATHRMIHRCLFDGKSPEAYKAYAKRAAAAASDAELRAVNAERRIENMYKALYMSSHVGEEFDAVINSVTQFGIFAVLENTCEGLIPMSELDGAFTFDEKTHTLRSSRAVFRLADRIRVRLEESDVMRGKMRFSVISRLPQEGEG